MLKSPSSLLKLEDTELSFLYVRWEFTSLWLAYPCLQTWRMITVLRWLQGSNEAVSWSCLLNGLEIWLGHFLVMFSSVQLLSRVQLCYPMNCSTPGLPVHNQLPEFTQTHVHWVADAIQLSHPLSFPSPHALVFPSIRVFSNESVLHIRWPSEGDWVFFLIQMECSKNRVLVLESSIPRHILTKEITKLIQRIY